MERTIWFVPCELKSIVHVLSGTSAGTRVTTHIELLHFVLDVQVLQQGVVDFLFNNLLVWFNRVDPHVEFIVGAESFKSLLAFQVVQQISSSFGLLSFFTGSTEVHLSFLETWLFELFLHLSHMSSISTGTFSFPFRKYIGLELLNSDLLLRSVFVAREKIFYFLKKPSNELLFWTLHRIILVNIIVQPVHIVLIVVLPSGAFVLQLHVTEGHQVGCVVRCVLLLLCLLLLLH